MSFEKLNQQSTVWNGVFVYLELNSNELEIELSWSSLNNPAVCILPHSALTIQFQTSADSHNSGPSMFRFGWNPKWQKPDFPSRPPLFSRGLHRKESGPQTDFIRLCWNRKRDNKSSRTFSIVMFPRCQPLQTTFLMSSISSWARSHFSMTPFPLPAAHWMKSDTENEFDGSVSLGVRTSWQKSWKHFRGQVIIV